MAATKPTYAKMKLKMNTETTTIMIGEQEVHVLKYLPIEDKLSLIMISLQSAVYDGVINEILLEKAFNLNLVYYYTDIVFTDKQRENEFKLYDELESNGIINQIIEYIPEYNDLIDYLYKIKKAKMEYNISASALVDSLINNLPEQAAAAAEIVDKFDPEKYQAVIDFAKAANNGVLPS